MKKKKLKVLAIGGVPCSGKSTLLRKIIFELGRDKILKIKTLTYHQFDEYKTIILGTYAKGEKFPGTDRLSMAVQPIAEKVLKNWSDDPERKNWTVIFEGDRLFGMSFLNALRENSQIRLKVFILKADDSTLEFRHNDREDSQSESWLKSKITKIEHIKESFNDAIILKNQMKQDLLDAVSRILEEITGY